jgi:hypothetical protein
MKPMILTNVAGESRRLNPMQVVGWVATEHELGNGRYQRGTLLAMSSGPPIAVLESEAQVDWMFEQASQGMVVVTGPSKAEIRAGLIDYLNGFEDSEAEASS